MKVEILEEVLKAKGATYERGDRITVDDERGKRWCELGWAKDLSGAVDGRAKAGSGEAQCRQLSDRVRNHGQMGE